MAQHPRPVGPAAQNNAATISVEMFQGARPAPKWNGYSTRVKGGHSVSQTTHVAAPFVPAMVDVQRPTTPRLFSTRTKVGHSVSQPTHVQAPFIPAMIDAFRPWKPRLPMLARAPGVAPPDVTAFAFEMFFDARPPQPRPHRPTKGPSFFPFSGTTSSTIEAADAWAPDSSRARAPKRDGWVAVPPTVDPFSIEMVLGYKPDRPRLFLAPRIPLPVSQPTHVNAAFTVDMVEGWLPDRHRYSAPVHQGRLAQTVDVLDFSIEMVIGSKPDQPRLFLAPRIPLPWSQTTPVSAPFTADMVEGWVPGRQRYGAPFHQGAQLWTPEVFAFSIEMTYGYKPDSPRLEPSGVYAKRAGWSSSQPTHVAAPFTVDMISGWHPDRYRYGAPFHQGQQLWTVEVSVFDFTTTFGSKPEKPRLEPSGTHTRRAGWAASQPTHVSAPFTVDMAAGWTPTRHRYTAPLHVGVSWWPPDVDAFSIEMVKGWRPDSPRLFLAPRIPLPVSQTSHVSATITIDMSGVQPQRHRYSAPFHQGLSILDTTGIISLTPSSPSEGRTVTVPVNIRLVVVPEDIRST